MYAPGFEKDQAEQLRLKLLRLVQVHLVVLNTH